jgi:hypothetical protein
MYTIKKILFTVTLLTPVISMAADLPTTVCEVQMNDTGRAYIKPCETWQSKNGCTGHWITWDANTDPGKAMYSTALTAFAAGHSLVVRVDGVSCSSGYDVTSMLRVRK